MRRVIRPSPATCSDAERPLLIPCLRMRRPLSISKKPPERWTDTDTVRLCLGGTDFVRLWRRCINNGLPEEAEVELPEMLRFMRSAARWWF